MVDFYVNNSYADQCKCINFLKVYAVVLVCKTNMICFFLNFYLLFSWLVLFKVKIFIPTDLSLMQKISNLEINKLAIHKTS